MNGSSHEDLISDWFAGDSLMFDAATEEPEQAWLAILGILQRDLSQDQLADLAAGPLETLLSWHAPAFISRVEVEAAKNPRFNKLLGGVWKQDMPDEIWQRIVRARKEVW